LTDILEVEFQLGYAMGIRPNFNDVEFYELIWMFERMAEQKQKENEAQQKSQGNMTMADVLGGRQGGKFR
jgi:hypothetical protein